MDIIFMNPENSKTSDPHRLLLNYKFKYQLQRGMKILNYPMNHILYQIFKIMSSISSKSIKQ